MNRENDPQEIKTIIDSFSQEPTPRGAHILGKAIIAASITNVEKRNLFGIIFKYKIYEEKVEAILNLWAVLAMLESPNLEPARKIDAARGLLHDAHVSDDDLNEWVTLTWSVTSIVPEDVLEFLAHDFRNLAKNRLSTTNLEKLNSY